jgi:hypothetical protein
VNDVRPTPILLVVVGVGAAVLAWSRFSGDSWVALDESSRSGLDSEEGVAGEDGWADSGGVPAAAGERAGGERGAGSPFREKRVGRDLSASSGRAAAGGSASVHTSGDRERGGTLGFSATGRAAGGGGSASLGGAPFGGDRGKDLGSDRPHQADVKDFLAQQPPGAQRSDPAEEDTAEDSSEVVLSVPLNQQFGTDATQGARPIVEQDLQFADDGEGVKFDTESVLAFPDAGNVQNSAGTITFEFEPDWEGGEAGDYNFVNVRTPNDPRNLLRVFKNGRYLRFLFADETGRERNIGFDMADWQPGERHRVTATWGDNQTALYVDDQLAGTNTYEGELNIPPGTPLYLGSDVPQAAPSGAGAIISNFEVFGRSLQRNEVASLPIGQRQ